MIAKDQADIWEHIKPILAKNRYLIFLIELIIILSFINSHLFTLAVVKGDSMYPTLSDRDIVLVSCSNQMPERGDIVLAHAALDEMDRSDTESTAFWQSCPGAFWASKGSGAGP